jgi:hypothetical protein
MSSRVVRTIAAQAACGVIEPGWASASHQFFVSVSPAADAQANRLNRLVVEAGLGHLPFSEKTVTTPTGGGM